MAKKYSQRQQVQRRSTRSHLPLWVWAIGGGVLALLVVAGLFYLGYNNPVASNGDISGLVISPDPGRDHVEGDIEYALDAPPGGPHNPTWLNCGIYDQPVRTEHAVHSLEHGAVWLAYQPDLPAEQLDSLRALVRDEQRRLGERLIILSPKADLTDPIVATAWQVQLRLADPTDERLVQFVRRYQKGPYTPEPGADCTFGGIGEPMS